MYEKFQIFKIEFSWCVLFILSFNMNFSIYGIMDVLHNTCGNFEESASGKHNKTLFSLKSVREISNEGERKQG